MVSEDRPGQEQWDNLAAPHSYPYRACSSFDQLALTQEPDESLIPGHGITYPESIRTSIAEDRIVSSRDVRQPDIIQSRLVLQ